MILVGFDGVQHDNSVCAYIDGVIKYAKSERCTGIKHDKQSLSWVVLKLKEWGVDIDEVDAFASDWNSTILEVPNPKFTIDPFVGTYTPLNAGYPIHGKKSKNITLNHHFAHAWSNLNFDLNQSKALVVDGYGWDRYSSWLYKNRLNEIDMFKWCTSGRLLATLGTSMGMGGMRLDIPGKIMGLQSYGEPDQEFIDHWLCAVPHGMDELRDRIEGFNFTQDLSNQDNINFISTIFQLGFENQKIYFDYYDKGDKLIFSGGTAQNVNWNRDFLDLGYELDIQPHVSDECISIGCVRYLCHLYGVDFSFENFPYCQDDEAPSTQPSNETIEQVSNLLASGKIVGWYQGHGELGPRALGNRSILMNPSVKDGKDTINQKVKHREWWRPFGASVKQDKASEYFDLDNSPYMLYTAKVLNSNLHSITHVDGTCRHQTVTPEQNPLFYDLLDAFESKTGLPVLLNTSLNLGGKPIAGKIEEAIELFNTSEMDALCVGNDLYIK